MLFDEFATVQVTLVSVLLLANRANQFVGDRDPAFETSLVYVELGTFAKTGRDHVARRSVGKGFKTNAALSLFKEMNYFSRVVDGLDLTVLKY